MTHSAVDWLLVIMWGTATVVMIALPWGVVTLAYKKRNNGLEPINGLAVLVCILLCIFEIAALVDWIFGNTSRFLS